MPVALRTSLLLTLVLLCTWGLLGVKSFIVPLIHPSWSAHSYLDTQLKYQVCTLGLVIIFLFLLRHFRATAFAKYFRCGDVGAPAKRLAFFGIQDGESWGMIGPRLMIIITLVTVAVMGVQLPAGHTWFIDWSFVLIPFLAVSNAFVEEMITRFGVVVSLTGVISDRQITVVSGVVFGTVHYFGNPGGVVGVLVAGILGWVLARTVLETRGIFWAWSIHALQDVVIMGGLLVTG